MYKKYVCAFFLLLTVLIYPANSAFISGNYFENITPEAIQDGSGTISAYNCFSSRASKIEKTFGCTFYFQFWKTLSDSDYESFEAATEDFSCYAADDNVLLFFVQDINQAYIHIGKDLATTNAESAVKAALCTQENLSNYDRVMSLLRTLWNVLAADQMYMTDVVSVGPHLDKSQIEAALAPLRTKFAGPISVYYFYTDSVGESQDISTFSSDFCSDRNGQFWEDSILLVYDGNTGTANCRIGALTGMKWKPFFNVTSAFQTATGAGDYSGFETGIQEISNNLVTEKNYVQTLAIYGILGMAGIVALLIACFLYHRKTAH